MTAAGDTPNLRSEVRIRGRPWSALVIVLVLLSVATAMGLGASSLAGVLGSDYESMLFTLVAGVLIWGIALSLFFCFTVSEVRISEIGLSFKVGTGWRSASWEEVLPPRYPLSFGTIPIEWGPNGESHVNVSRHLALSIVAANSHPPWNLPSSVRASLGLDST